MATTQLVYRKNGESHYFMGADSLSTGVMVSNTNLKEAFDEAEKQLSRVLHDNHQISASVRLPVTFEELEKYLADKTATSLLWLIEEWR